MSKRQVIRSSKARIMGPLQGGKSGFYHSGNWNTNGVEFHLKQDLSEWAEQTAQDASVSLNRPRTDKGVQWYCLLEATWSESIEAFDWLWLIIYIHLVSYRYVDNRTRSFYTESSASTLVGDVFLLTLPKGGRT